MRFRVTVEDIHDGVASDCQKCPVFRSARRILGPVLLSVEAEELVLQGPKGRDDIVRVAHDAGKFIDRFDRTHWREYSWNELEERNPQRLVEPFIFEANV